MSPPTKIRNDLKKVGSLNPCLSPPKNKKKRSPKAHDFDSPFLFLRIFLCWRNGANPILVGQELLWSAKRPVFWVVLPPKKSYSKWPLKDSWWPKKTLLQGVRSNEGLTINRSRRILPSLKLTVRTWKCMVGILVYLVSFWGPAYFQGQTVSFREGISMISLTNQVTLLVVTFSVPKKGHLKRNTPNGGHEGSGFVSSRIPG